MNPLIHKDLAELAKLKRKIAMTKAYLTKLEAALKVAQKEMKK